jgi:hypothetical protein
VQVGQTKVNPPFLLDRIVGVSTLRWMLLDLPPGQLGMSFTRLVEIPESRAASSFPPTA